MERLPTEYREVLSGITDNAKARTGACHRRLETAAA